MPEAFDAYYHWLGISPGEQPPHYYRLLGLREFEPDPRAIAAAADRLTLHLQSYQAGPYYQLAGKLLMEVAAARSCLLDPPRRAAYDQQLHMVMATRGGKGDNPHLCEAPSGLFRPMGAVPLSPYATPPGGQYSPERPLAPPPPPGSGAPASPTVGQYAQQPFAAPNTYLPASVAAPMAYPPTMSPAPAAYPSAPLAAPSGYPLSRPSAPAPYPGAATVPSTYPGGKGDSPRPTVSQCPPERPSECFPQMGTVPISPGAPSEPAWAVESLEDDSELPSSGQSMRRLLRRTFRRRDEGSYYLIAGLVGLVSLVVVFGILLARHPLDRIFDTYHEKKPTPHAPALKPKPMVPPKS